MNNSGSVRTPLSLTGKRILRLVGLVFFTMWLISTVIFLIIHAAWTEYVGSAIVFGGFFFAWMIAIYALKKKNPEFIEAMIPAEEKDEQTCSKPTTLKK